MGKKVLHIDEASCLIAEISNLLNQRPISYVFENREEKLLRPLDLINPGQINYNPFLLANDEEEEYFPKRSTKENLLASWRDLNKKLKNFWQFWSTDYLNYLRERKDRFHKQGPTGESDPKEGDVVIIKTEHFTNRFAGLSGPWLA